MATVNKYLQIDNTSVAHNAVFGASLPAGGGSGTDISPWSTWSAASTEIKSTAPDHSADDLVVHMHPACTVSVAAANLDIWTDIGRGTRYKSVTLKRWEQKVIDDPRYEGWRPCFDTTQNTTSWTSGTVSGGVFTPGTGPVWKSNTFVTAAYDPISTPSSAAGYFMAWGGHENGDSRIRQIDPYVPTVEGLTVCQNLNLLTECGDYCWVVSSGSNSDLYVHTGSTTLNPTQAFGSIAWQCATGNYQSGLYIRNCRNITFEDVMILGNGVDLKEGALSGEINDNIRFIRPWLGLNLKNCLAGYTGDPSVGVPGTNVCTNIMIDTPTGNTVDTKRMKGPMYAGRSSQNMISFVGQIDGLEIVDPILCGSSHGHIQCHHANVNTTYVDQYPKNIKVWVKTPGRGRIICSPNYSRAFTMLVPINASIRGLRVSNQTTQSQFGGTVDVVNVWFDDTCVNWRDNAGSPSTNNNNNAHLWYQPGPYSTYFGNGVERSRVIGGKHHIKDNFAFWGLTTAAITPPGSVQFIGCLLYDEGGVRYRQESSEANQGWTRYKTPFICVTKSAEVGPVYGISRNMVVLAPGCDGLAARTTVAADPTSNASGANFALTAVTATDWTGNISDNVPGTLAEFGFDASLNYNGARKTPAQTGPRVGRGYR